MTTIEQLRRKANQHWELAGLARLDRDFADEARHMRLARELERRIREMKVFGEDERDRLEERVAELEREREELKHELERYRRLIRSTHKRAVTHANCEDEFCAICIGGLFICADCGAAEVEAEERICERKEP